MTDDPIRRRVEEALRRIGHEKIGWKDARVEIELERVQLEAVAEVMEEATPLDSESLYTQSARDEARKIIRDCKDSAGVLHEPSLLHAISTVFVTLYRVQNRLPTFRNVRGGGQP